MERDKVFEKQKADRAAASASSSHTGRKDDPWLSEDIIVKVLSHVVCFGLLCHLAAWTLSLLLTQVCCIRHCSIVCSEDETFISAPSKLTLYGSKVYAKLVASNELSSCAARVKF